MHTAVSHLVASYGYGVLFLLVAVESFGIPLPGETALVSAAAFAGTGGLNILYVIAAAALGAIAGDNGGYWLGRKGGVTLVRRYGRHLGLDDQKLERAHAFFERHGGKTVFIGRFIALLRSWAAALAGVSCMPYGKFMAYNAAGGIAWSALFGTLGYVFGRNLPLLERYMGQASLALVLLLALVVIIWLGVRWFGPRRERVAHWVVERWSAAARSPRLTAIRARYPRAWTFLAARLARGEYLGLHLTIGIVISLGAAWLFGGVTEDVIHHDPLTRVDLQVATWFRAHATPLGDAVGVFFSTIGSPVGMAVLCAIVLIVLLYRRWWITLAGWLAAFAGAGVIDHFIKIIIRRPRPEGAARFLHGASFSFPSGHALGSLVGFGMLAYLLIEFWGPAHRHRVAVTILATLLVVAIGLSRLYLVVHYLSDVIAGYAAALVWLAACITGVEIALRQRGLDAWAVGVERRRTPRTQASGGNQPVRS